MRRVLVAVVLLALALPGCGVVLSPRYSQLLDQTAAVSAETARRAEAGTLSEGDKTSALTEQAKVWRKFQDARDGRESGE